jgi:hypothetical protein
MKKKRNEEKNKKRYWLTQGMRMPMKRQKVEEMVIVERGKGIRRGKKS